MKNLIILFTTALIFISCGVKLDESEIDYLVFDYDRGLMIGVDIGDSWEDVKKSHNENWSIVENGNINQLRKDWDEGNNMMNISFSLDDNKLITDMSFSMFASGGNIETLTKTKNTISYDFDSRLNKLDDNKWSYFTSDGSEYYIILMEIVTDNDRKSFEFYTTKI